ncbi:hypothetical protein [Thiomonas sp. X19]|nr:hypothetical protein [Thiomonas sp. X19]
MSQEQFSFVPSQNPQQGFGLRADFTDQHEKTRPHSDGKKQQCMRTAPA